jgi:hypothetical protein
MVNISAHHVLLYQIKRTAGACLCITVRRAAGFLLNLPEKFNNLMNNSMNFYFTAFIINISCHTKLERHSLPKEFTLLISPYGLRQHWPV